MSKLRANSRTNKQTILTNEYENERISRIRENKLKLQSLGIKHIANSLTSLVDDTNAKRAKGKQKSQMDNDVEYVPCCDDADEEFNPYGNELHEQEHDHASTCIKKTRSSTKAKGLQMKQTIAPMSMANFLLMIVGDEALKKVAAAFKAVEQAAMSNQQQLDENIVPNDEETNDEVFAENIYGDTHGDLDDQQFSDDNYDHINFEIEGADQEQDTLWKIKTCPLGIKWVAMKKEDLSILLTMLPRGEKLTVEFDNDGILVGANGSNFSFFLGNQVRNRTVIPIQVSGWDKIKPEALEHLWSCVQGVFSFDSPELRKEAILRHARALFRDSRHKLKRKYFDNPKLKTKADRMKNRPVYMLDADWKYLVNLWSSAEFQKEKYGRECSRLDLMLKSRTRTSDKSVNAENLANSMHAKDTHGYLHAYGRGKSITDYFGVRPSCLDLAQDVMELKKRANESVMKAKKDVEEARKEAEHAKLEAEQAKKETEDARKEAETTRQEVDAKIEANNKMWEKKMKNMLEEFLRSSTHGDFECLNILTNRGTLQQTEVTACNTSVDSSIEFSTSSYNYNRAVQGTVASVDLEAATGCEEEATCLI
ncbi:hypothetical protein Cgig2_012143 [Carnegiea gigantea]|uniref:Transposase, Ptta/En/Spm, plant n=1 Tax=Carnegiea gigantea TaxID=171969 RepID=A0A9Q1QNN1_9CARY|nr:hypothetical protein Cgig2_012143 [Carnegiea gigantea]